MSIKAMKFEEITVTFQPINPKIPSINITEVEHPSKGITTHFIFLKIIQRVINMKIKTPIPNTMISFFINVIISSDIIGIPPK